MSDKPSAADYKALVESANAVLHALQADGTINRGDTANVIRNLAVAIESLSEQLDIAAGFGVAEYNRAERAEAQLATIASMFSIRRDNFRSELWTWDFHGVRYESLAEALAAQKEGKK